MALVLLGNMSRGSTKCMKIFLNPLPKHCTYSRDPIDDSDSVAEVLDQESAFFYDSFYNRRDVPTTTVLSHLRGKHLSDVSRMQARASAHMD